MSRMFLRPLLMALGCVLGLLLVVALLWYTFLSKPRPFLSVGSKAFTESVILAEMARLIGVEEGVTTRHLVRLGDTSKTWNALLVGELDLYIEYTGTLMFEIFSRERPDSIKDVERLLAERGLRMSKSLGFRNNYALGMRADHAKKLGIRTISDLRKHPTLRLGLSHAFIERADGWHKLKQRYNLPFETPRGMEHSLAYRGLTEGSLDVVDLYTTDAEIVRYELVVLEDDFNFFPAYFAVLVYREDFANRAPELLQAILQLQGKIDEKTMQQLNTQTNVARVPETVVASDFLVQKMNIHVPVERVPLSVRLLRRTGEHLTLVLISLIAAIATAVPMGIIASRRPVTGQILLGSVAVVQTFPSLALLSVLILLLRQTGAWPAIVALYVYSLLPIVRNTYTGMKDVPLLLRESANALGLSAWAKLTLIELPMASRAILAGIKTAAVINVGFATLGGLIGAGGYGQPIMSGLDKNDYRLILEGAIPAVLLALAVQGLFELTERWLVPLGLRLRPVE